jgi:membrane protease YdiL (CAAX protease family)
MHVFNLVSGRELAWVLGQIVWASILGIFYGYLVIRTGSLLPAMIVHYLGNVFVGSLTGYIGDLASIQVQALYGIVFSFGLLPTSLMILWTRFFTARMPFSVE